MTVFFSVHLLFDKSNDRNKSDLTLIWLNSKHFGDRNGLISIKAYSNDISNVASDIKNTNPDSCIQIKNKHYFMSNGVLYFANLNWEKRENLSIKRSKIGTTIYDRIKLRVILGYKNRGEFYGIGLDKKTIYELDCKYKTCKIEGHKVCE